MTDAEEQQQAEWIVREIRDFLEPLGRKIRFMEVCGTHTVSIFRAGLRQLLPDYVELISGPGCPVCVTPDGYMDLAIAYARRPEIIIATFGDMLKVPGSESSLEAERAAGADIRIVYSPLDCLAIAENNPKKVVVFLAVGFETTAPAEAAAVIAAAEKGLKNFFLLPALKLVPPALRFLLRDEMSRPDGFLLPGHVAVITGTNQFTFVSDEYSVPGVVAGFEPLQILRALYELARSTAHQKPAIINAYPGVVKSAGNQEAQKIMNEVFLETQAEWRGLGNLEKSGLCLRGKYQAFDIQEYLPISINLTAKKSACRCGDVLKGTIIPPECPLFGKSCTPLAARGPCMVSVEGVCAAWYKYNGGRFRYER